MPGAIAQAAAAAQEGAREVAMNMPSGYRVGHWSDPEARTGCTVVIPPPGSRGGVCVQGGGPGTRETDVLGPLANAEHATAVLLTGGSAFGLAAADGVVRWCEEHGLGYETPAAKVPLVPAAVIYDLASGSADVRPGPDAGYAACEAAAGGAPETGSVGAGTGAMVGKLLGHERASEGGVGFASATTGAGEVVCAVAVCNAVGEVLGADGQILAGIAPEGGEAAPRSADLIERMDMIGPAGEAPAGEPPARNSTLVCVCTDAALGKRECAVVARMATAGMARAIDPVFTPVDGDVVFCLASGTGEARPFLALQAGVVAASVTAAAIRDAVR
jgi:L-aminopeptidase/D-esterase-like protein